MPSDQLLKCLTIAALGLFDKDFLVVRFVNSLCGPFQYGFHGHGVFDARKTKRLGGNSGLAEIPSRNFRPGFVPRNYSIDESLLSGGNPIQIPGRLHLMDDVLGGRTTAACEEAGACPTTNFFPTASRFDC